MDVGIKLWISYPIVLVEIMIVIIRIDQEKYLFSLLDLAPSGKTQYSSYGCWRSSAKRRITIIIMFTRLMIQMTGLTWFGYWQEFSSNHFLFQSLSLKIESQIKWHLKWWCSKALFVKFVANNLSWGNHIEIVIFVDGNWFCEWWGLTFITVIRKSIWWYSE